MLQRPELLRELDREREGRGDSELLGEEGVERRIRGGWVEDTGGGEARVVERIVVGEEARQFVQEG